MKILMLTDVFFPDTIGGAGRVAYHLALELSGKGNEVHIITRNPDGKFLNHQKYNPSIFIHRFLSPKQESTKLFLSEIKNSYSMTKDLSRKIEFDIVCVHQSMVAMGPLFLGQLKSMPLLYYYHSPWHEEYLVKKNIKLDSPKKRDRLIAFFMRCIEKRILLKSSKVIVLSKYMRDKLLVINKFPRSRISIIPGGVDPNRFHLPDSEKITAKQKAEVPLDKTIFLTVRNLVPRMGLENLIEAFNQSKTLREKGVLFIGGSGFLLDRLKVMVDRLRLNDTINFLGHIPDDELPGIYQAADYFILPTERLEGFGLVILEAMSCGIPVLGTPVGAITEVLGSFDERLLFDGTSWNDLKTKMENVIENPEIYQYEPQACRNFVEDNYSWKRVADDFEKVAIGLMP